MQKELDYYKSPDFDPNAAPPVFEEDEDEEDDDVDVGGWAVLVR